MRLTTSVLVTALCLSVVSSNPLPEGERLQSKALDRLVMVEAENDPTLRSKRTIGILRQLFPELSQIVEQKVNMITTELFRILGPVFLRGAIGGGGAAGGGGGTSGTTVTVASPFDDDDDFFNDGSKTSGVSQDGSQVSVDLATFPPDENESEDSNSSTIQSETTTLITSINNLVTNSTENTV